MIILGLPSFHHSGWGLVKDGKVLRAIQEERLNRIKNYPYNTDLNKYPMSLGIDYLFKGQSFTLSDCDAVTIPALPSEEKYHELDMLELESVDEVLWQNLKPDYNDVLKLIKSKGFKGKVVFVNHQLCHAAYVYNYSGYKTSDVISYDGAGCGWPPEVVAAFHVEDHSYKKIFSHRVPHSLGHIYSNTTRTIFGDHADGEEGKTMGLAPYGQANPKLKMMQLDEKNKRYVATYTNTTKMPYTGVEPYASTIGLRQENLPKRERKKTWDLNSDSDKYFADLAATAQSSIEEAGVYYVNELKKATNCDNLCIAGGVALNSCLNGLIRRLGIYDSTFAGPASHDGGTGLGASLYYSNLADSNKTPKIENDFLGYPYNTADCKNAAQELDVKFEELDNLESVGADAAQSLIDQKIIAIFRGASEFGPRALGHRSIMVDPRSAEMKDTLNAKVKFREGFRPFAPIVLKEHAREYFEFEESDYMLFVAKSTDKAINEVPATIHIDGTARMQTIDEKNQPFHEILKNFQRKTGTPVLLNTSFNVAGEPMIETPQDAIRCFLGTAIDILYLDNLKITKKDN
tara:strand:- start:429 stop:2147 length:1719 start_codon:yes stop_codon:yes gene_type:complete